MYIYIIHPKMNIYMKFHKNQKMVKFRGKMFSGKFHMGGGKFRGEFLKKKNEYLQNGVAK